MNTLDREKLFFHTFIGDETRPDSLGYKIHHIGEHQADDLADVTIARDFVRSALNEYLNSAAKFVEVTWDVPVTHTEYREFRDAARGLIMAMQGLTPYDGEVAPLLQELTAVVTPFIEERAELTIAKEGPRANALNRQKLGEVLPPLRDVGELEGKITSYCQHSEADSPEVRGARDFLKAMHKDYMLAHELSVSAVWNASTSHTEFRDLREAAQGLVMAMQGLAKFDEAITPDLAALETHLSPVLLKRADQYRAEAEAKAGTPAQR